MAKNEVEELAYTKILTIQNYFTGKYIGNFQIALLKKLTLGMFL